VKSAIVILAHDAEKRGFWREVLSSVACQDLRTDAKIVIDSGSCDGTVAAAVTCGWRVIRICREKFDHGTTRSRVVRCLHRRNFDTVIFLSQDAVLSAPDTLRKLTDFLHGNPVSGCFGRQTGRDERSFDSRQRARLYPPVSRIKTLADVPELGLVTPFFSNAFSAWKTAEVVKSGGFPPSMFAEDMLLAAKILNAGNAVGYCAEAVVIHEHPCDMRSLFRRGYAVGAFHLRHPELRRQFGPVRSPFSGRDVFETPLAFAVKSSGYFCGRAGDGLVPWGLFCLMWLLLIPAMYFYDLPLRDVADRYAPMAEAFAAGDWGFAFHPRVTPLLPVLAGTIARLLPLGGHAACQLAGGLMYTIGVFPLWSGCRKVYGKSTALWGALMYACCPPLFRLGYCGTRESCCVFGLLLLFYAAADFYTGKNDRRACLAFAAGEAVLLLSRGDVALFSLAAFAVFAVWEIVIRRRILRFALTAALMLLPLLPVLYRNYREIGYPVPEVRHAAAARKFCRRFPVFRFLENPRPRLALDVEMPGGKVRK